MDELHELLAGGSHNVSLDIAALQLATVEFPDLTASPFLMLLDSYASEAGERIPKEATGLEFIQRLNDYLFHELGFTPNTRDYYQPANSCLNQVLLERTGIPITLSLVYMEISRRLGRTVFGIGLPGHFIVQYRGEDMNAFVDPFHGGRILTEAECNRLAFEVTGIPVGMRSSVLQPVPKRYILVRMLNNLRAAYVRLQDTEKTLRVLDLLIRAMPKSPEEYKQRAVCQLQLERLDQARENFEKYLELAPQAQDREEVTRQIEWIRSRRPN